MPVRAKPPAKIVQTFEFNSAYWSDLKKSIIKALVAARFQKGRIKSEVDPGCNGFLIGPRDKGCAAGVYFYYLEHVDRETYETVRDDELEAMKNVLKRAGFDIKVCSEGNDWRANFLLVQQY